MSIESLTIDASRLWSGEQARAAAARVSVERGKPLGDEVGYHVRFEHRSGRNTRILVATEGVFLRWLQDDPFLDRLGLVIFDEFHERNLNTDLALAMVRRVQQTVRPDLRVVVMSATLDPAPVSKFLGDCPCVSSEGRLFPLTVSYTPYSPAPLEDQVGLPAFTQTKAEVISVRPELLDII